MKNREFKMAVKDREIKTVKFEIKEVDDEEGTFTGYAATFSKTPDSYGDIIEPGAFTKTIKERKDKIKILWQHSPYEPIGKPLEMTEDEKGLFVKGKISTGVQRGREVMVLMKDKVITELSIGYETIKQEWDKGIRHLKELKLYDFSPVTFAANEEAEITAVKQAELKPFPNEHACRLRDPDDFEEGSFRRTTRVSDGKKYSVIMGRLEDEETMTEQAYRYNKEIWEAADAKVHCGDHDGTFEAASEEEGKSSMSKLRAALATFQGLLDEDKEGKSGRVLSESSMTKLRAALAALQALLDSAEKEPDPSKSQSDLEVDKEEAAELEALVLGMKAENEDFDIRQAEARINAMLVRLKQ